MTGDLFEAGDLHGRALVRVPGRGTVTVAGGFLGPGWRARFVNPRFAPTYLLELAHQDGQETAWFLDADMAHIANGFAELSQDRQEQIRAIAGAWLEHITHHVLGVGPDAVLDAMTHVRAATLNDILPPDEAPGETETYVMISALQQPERFPQLTADGATVSVSSEFIGQALDQDILPLAGRAVRENGLSLPSPVDGLERTTNMCLLLSHFVFAYRFQDPGSGLVYFAIATKHVCKTVALYFPGTRQCFVATHADRNYLRAGHPGMAIHQCLRRHIRDHAAALSAFLAAPERRISLLYHHDHLGHHLWQELTGLDFVLQTMGDATPPETFILNSSHTEMFGRIDALFPSLKGRVNREHTNAWSAARDAYTRRLCILNPCGYRIRNGLANRIKDLAGASQAITEDRDLLRDLRVRRLPVMLLGLRVENRTVVDLPVFCASLLDALLRETGGAAVLIDGHNSGVEESSGDVFNSAGQHLATRAPIDAERDVVRLLRERFAGSALRLIDCVGAPMTRSVFWSSNADFFVTPWGASLVKYRWIGNLPGLIVAGRGHLDSGHDIDIYQSQNYMENPAPVRFVDAAYVSDVPEAEQLIETGEHSRISFRVDMAGVIPHLQDLLAETWR